MTVTKLCGCTVVFWCYLILFFDIFLGLLFAMKHFDFNWFDLKATANRASFWGRADRCLDLGLGKVGMAIEMSLLLISIIALFGLCCRKSKFLLPYLIFKIVVIVIYVYMGVMYAMHYKNCGGWLFAQALAIVFALISYAIVAGTYKAIKQEYSTIDHFIP
ncbi:unnamed protein product, partial [Mesorhabditis belari]|uniref:Uncharacterized protein n=1 Tax=Mesorhabditis belari TaxID=2138241 RepID=A0AAF3FHD6_9BILA